MPRLKIIHKCSDHVTMSWHGYYCASILAGKIKDADFFGHGNGKQIRGVIPSADLHLYGFSCSTCCGNKLINQNFFEILNEVVKDKIRILSASFEMKSPYYDQKILELFKSNILVVNSAGNNGPKEATMANEMPWCLTVGACNSGMTPKAVVEIGTTATVPANIRTLKTMLDEGREIKILSQFEVRVIYMLPLFTFNY